MKILKVTDVVIQVGMLVFFLMKAIRNEEGMDRIIYAYFWVGGYQFTSCMAQYLAGYNQQLNSSRALYQSILRWVVAIGIISLPLYMFFLIGLLIFSPLMALFYTGLSIRETVKIIGYEK